MKANFTTGAIVSSVPVKVQKETVTATVYGSER